MATFDEMLVKFLFDTSDLQKGAKEATATTAKLSTDLVATAEKGEKAQTSALGQIIKGWNAFVVTNRKAADAAVQNSKAMSTATESVVQSGEKALRTFGALFLLFAGARSVKDFAADMLGVDAALGRTAKSIGQTPEALSGIGRAVERMGGTFGGAVGGLKGLSDAFEQMRTTGNTAIMEPLARLQGLSGKAIHLGKDVRENFLSIADALHAEMAKDPAMADYLGRQIFGDEGLTNLAKKGRAGASAEIDRSPKITRQQTEDAQKLQEQLVAIRQGFQDIGNSILMDFGPPMIKAAQWVKDLLDKNRGLIETKVSEWVKDVGAWFQAHKSDVEAFGKAVGDLAIAAGAIATAFASQSPAMQALELFAAVMGGTVLRAVTGLSGALGALFALPAPAWFLALNPAVLGTAAVGAVLASGDPNKSVLAGGHPDVQPQDNDLGLPGVGDRKSDTSDVQSKVGGFWGWMKETAKKLGFGDRLHDDPKIKDGITDTAKATGEMRDILKAQKDGTAGAIAAGGITIGGGAPNLRYGHGSGGSYRATPGTEGGAPIGQGAKGGSFKGGGANAAMAKEAYDFWRGKGLDHNAALSMVAQEQGESGFNVRSRGDYVNGNPTAHGIFQWHADRRAAILKATGINVDTADHKQQLEAAFYEGTKGMRAGFLQSLNGRSLADAVHQGVHRFEGSANQVKDTAVRLRMAQGWDGGGSFMEPKPTAQAPVAAGTSAAAITDAEVFAARQRITNGSRDPKDHALVDRYLKQQNAPKALPAVTDDVYAAARRVAEQAKHIDPAKMTADQRRAVAMTGDIIKRYEDAHRGTHALDPARQKLADAMKADTVGHAIHHALRAVAHANSLLHHNDNHPISVEMSDRGAERIGKRTFGWYVNYAKKHQDEMPKAHARALDHAAALHRMTHLAASSSYSRTTHNVNNSSDTRINGGIHVHTQATDARQIAADIEPHLHRGQAAGRADYGLA